MTQFCNWGLRDRDEHPINCVDWHQARAYCEWLGKRLPNEMEWEKAGRGVDGREFPWGDRWTGVRANIADVTSHRELNPHWKTEDAYDDGFATTSPVGSFPQGVSPFGVYDMAGNVWEWMDNVFGAVQHWRAIRGGSWQHLPGEARTALRSYNTENGADGYIGFRCARDG